MSKVRISLEAAAACSLTSAINWAKTNKGYSQMKEDFIYLVDVIVDNSRHPRDSDLYQRIKRRIVESTVREAAPSLSGAQQRKLRIVLDRLVPPKL